MPRAAFVCFAAVLVALTAVVALLGEVPGERRVADALSSSGALERVWRVVDFLTGYVGTSVLAGLLVVGLVAVRRRREALLTAASCLGALAGTTLLKHLVERPRPDGLPDWAQASAYSFPSGHATATAALAAVVFLLARVSRSVAAAAVLLVGLAAWAQLALGLHHPSDLLAGWLWAFLWTSALWRAGARRRPGQAVASPGARATGEVAG